MQAFWDAVPCGTRDLPTEDRRAFFRELEEERYHLEPYIKPFARFDASGGKDVLEIGVGAGTDFMQWARAGAHAVGIDLTQQGVELTRERLGLEGLRAPVINGDAENLPIRSGSLDLVYSWGVLHHSPDTPRAIREVHRVLKPGGVCRIMIYQSRSWVGLMLWAVHCLAKGQPWQSPTWAIYHHLESPGTKAYTIESARALFAPFSQVSVRPQLSHGDLLMMRPSSKYQSRWARLAWQAYPRPVIRSLGNALGLYLMIEAVK